MAPGLRPTWNATRLGTCATSTSLTPGSSPTAAAMRLLRRLGFQRTAWKLGVVTFERNLDA